VGGCRYQEGDCRGTVHCLLVVHELAADLEHQYEWIYVPNHQSINDEPSRMVDLAAVFIICMFTTQSGWFAIYLKASAYGPSRQLGYPSPFLSSHSSSTRPHFFLSRTTACRHPPASGCNSLLR
jgi:hypothetical protein